MREYCQHLAENVEQEFAIQLAGAGLGAIRELTTMLELPTATTDVGAISPHTKIEIATELLDRLPQTTRVNDRPTEGGDSGTLVQIINGMPDNELAQLIQQWRTSGSPDPAVIEA